MDISKNSSRLLEVSLCDCTYFSGKINRLNRMRLKNLFAIFLFNAIIHCTSVTANYLTKTVGLSARQINALKQKLQ